VRASGPPIEGPLRDLRFPVQQLALLLVAVGVMAFAPSAIPAAPAAAPAPADSWSLRQEAAAARAAALWDAGRPGPGRRGDDGGAQQPAGGDEAAGDPAGGDEAGGDPTAGDGAGGDGAGDEQPSVSFVVLDRTGTEVAAQDADRPVAAASTIKAMILAAYLRQPEVARRDLTSAERGALERMITFSANGDATKLLRTVGWPAMRELAEDAGIADGFTPDTKRWGLTLITARSLATFFHDLPGLLPARHRGFAMDLFAGIVPAQQWGMPAATPDDWQWHMKAGWISTVVNQVGSFTRGGDQFTVAITIDGEPGLGVWSADQDPADVPAIRTLAEVTGALFGGGEIPGGQPMTDCAVLVSGASRIPAPQWAQPCGGAGTTSAAG
jgi:beta-lactamase class A